MSKPKTSKRISSRQRRLAQLQVREYIDRYHPEFRNVAINVSPRGTIATVRKLPPDDHEQ